MTYPGKWHGDERHFGLHYDLHAGADDTELGTRCSEAELVPALQMIGADFVQTDCKGHPGYTSWFSKVAGASVPPGLTHDALMQWREATRKLGLPLHCHYSGIWDIAAGVKHPEWAVVGPDGEGGGAPFGQNAGAATKEIMCPRSAYRDELLIPQFLELIDRYEVDGFWVDGDLWAVQPCYCPACRGAWTAQMGHVDPPTQEDDPLWPQWWNFTRASFDEHVTKYCDAVHRHKPGVLICSNWLQTFKNPGEPTVPTDWISGDNAHVWGLDGSRCEARFLSTRGKPWDIMLWNFYCVHGMGLPDSPWTVKPPPMVMQEAAVLLAFGGNVQVYENPMVRDGRLIPWRQKRLAEVSAFVKARRTICQHTTTIPQVAILHSEHHLYSHVRSKNLFWGPDAKSVQGGTYSLLENSYGVDILDEWALKSRLAEFPVIVAPEQTRMSDQMVADLIGYVEAGGSLLLTGSDMYDRFGEEFLGFRSLDVETDTCYEVPAADGSVPLYSRQWRLGETTTGEAFGFLGLGSNLEGHVTAYPAAVVNRVGSGQVAYVPADLFRDFEHNHYPGTRRFVGELIDRLLPDPALRVNGPRCVDVTLRRRDRTTIIHLVNRASGLPNTPNNGAVDEIPPVGPITIRMRLSTRPNSVAVALEEGDPAWTWDDGVLTARLATVHIHAAVVVEA